MRWRPSDPSPRRSWPPLGAPRSLGGRDPRGLEGQALGALNVVVGPGHDALGIKAAPGLDLRHRMPAPEGVRREIADGVEELHAISPIGTKFKQPENLGPQSYANEFFAEFGDVKTFNQPLTRLYMIPI